jgi:hypothetical protein
MDFNNPGLLELRAKGSTVYDRKSIPAKTNSLHFCGRGAKASMKSPDLAEIA